MAQIIPQMTMEVVQPPSTPDKVIVYDWTPHNMLVGGDYMTWAPTIKKVCPGSHPNGKQGKLQVPIKYRNELNEIAHKINAGEIQPLLEVPKVSPTLQIPLGSTTLVPLEGLVQPTLVKPKAKRAKATPVDPKHVELNHEMLARVLVQQELIMNMLKGLSLGK